MNFENKLNGTITDIPGISLGHEEDEAGITGVTVVRFGKEGAVAGYDSRGGAPGTRETDLLAPWNFVDRIHALVLSGGSAFGLDSASGVMQCLEEEGVGFPTSKDIRVPVVPAAVIYDLEIGNSKIRPGLEMGYRACKNSTSKAAPQGNVGAGLGATVGKVLGMERAMKGGLGTHSIALDKRVIVAALVVVNALGDIVDPRSGKILAGTRAATKCKFADSKALMMDLQTKTIFGNLNTTIGLVATNAEYSKTELTKLAQMAQDGLVQTICPVHTMFDGDTIFAVSQGGEDAWSAPHLSAMGTAMAAVLSQAVVNAVNHAKSISGVPSGKDFLN